MQNAFHALAIESEEEEQGHIDALDELDEYVMQDKNNDPWTVRDQTELLAEKFKPEREELMQNIEESNKVEDTTHPWRRRAYQPR